MRVEGKCSGLCCRCGSDDVFQGCGEGKLRVAIRTNLAACSESRGSNMCYGCVLQARV